MMHVMDNNEEIYLESEEGECIPMEKATITMADVYKVLYSDEISGRCLDNSEDVYEVFRTLAKYATA